MVFLVIARLLWDKGIHEYVQAASQIRKKYPNAQFHLVGPFDPNPSAIQRKDIEAWVNQGVIIYHGEVTDVRAYISSCHVYVLPSYREGMPRTVLEAMAMARPIITTDAPGCRETVVDGVNGYRVKVQDSPSLYHAMEAFILNPQRIDTFGRQSRSLAKQKFDVKKINNTLLDVMGIR